MCLDDVFEILAIIQITMFSLFKTDNWNCYMGLAIRGIIKLHNYIMQLFFILSYVTCCCPPTRMTPAREGSPIFSFSAYLARSAVTKAVSVHKFRGDTVVRMWVQLKRLCVLCM